MLYQLSYTPRQTPIFAAKNCPTVGAARDLVALGGRRKGESQAGWDSLCTGWLACSGCLVGCATTRMYGVTVFHPAGNRRALPLPTATGR